uniref:hypothetical protein n=1 Tax=Congregibacter sp. TaxID=2744308 RepID=UPI003F6BAEDC
LPAARSAYLEACNAGSPPEHKQWSHPAVYWAGRDSGWQQLATSTEAQSWPLFKRHYQNRCATLLSGKEIPPVPEPEKNRLASTALEGEAALAQLQRLKNDNDL